MIKHKHASHVGFILSFVIFVTFVLFLFVILQPAKQANEEGENVLHQLQDAILMNVTNNLTIVSIKVSQWNPPVNPTENCFFVEEFPIDLESALVRDELNNPVPTNRRTGISFDGIYVARKSETETGYRFFIAQNIPEATDNSVDKCDSNEIEQGTNFEVTQIKSNRYVLEWFFTGYEGIDNPELKTVGLVENYEGVNGGVGYEQLKENLGLPSQNDFYFVFTEIGGIETRPSFYGTLGTTDYPQNVQVFSEELNVLYVDREANIKSGRLLVAVW